MKRTLKDTITCRLSRQEFEVDLTMLSTHTLHDLITRGIHQLVMDKIYAKYRSGWRDLTWNTKEGIIAAELKRIN